MLSKQVNRLPINNGGMKTITDRNGEAPEQQIGLTE